MWSNDASRTTCKSEETPITTGGGPPGHIDPGNEGVHDKRDEDDDVDAR
jgi:hypothetical protein